MPIVRRARMNWRDVERLVPCARRPATILEIRSSSIIAGSSGGTEAMRRPSAVVMNIPSIRGCVK